MTLVATFLASLLVGISFFANISPILKIILFAAGLTASVAIFKGILVKRSNSIKDYLQVIIDKLRQANHSIDGITENLKRDKQSESKKEERK